MKDKILANQMAVLCRQIDARVKCISLDCFDTVLWRQVATPLDVFYKMQAGAAFKEIGMSARLRVEAENRARKKAVLSSGKSEVTLRDIYLAHDDRLTDAQIEVLEGEELQAEKDVCYAFPYAVEAMRDAMELGLKVIIVSDTYLTETQLRSLLAHRLPRNVYEAISAVFCSCQYGYSKAAGLFNHVLNKIRQKPRSIYHVGDNRVADYLAPRALGISATHIVHHSEKIDELLRHRASAGVLFDSDLRHTRAIFNPFRGVVASGLNDKITPESGLGYLSLGPILYSFGQFVVDSVERLKAEGQSPKVAFLMRDGYLASRACEELAGKDFGRRVRVSRFAALGASFRSKRDVDQFLADTASTQSFLDICRQLLIPSEVAQEFDRRARNAKHPVAEFVRLIHQRKTLESIFESSASYRKRLIRHLQNEVGLVAGDTLILVDLGYTGTAQQRLQEVFKEDLDVGIQGRYLIALRTPRWERFRSGLLDPSWCDDRLMSALVSNIAIIEQLCTENEKSVVDYEEDGSPIFSEVSMSKAQHLKVEKIQEEVLRFIRDAKRFSEENQISFDSVGMRDLAMAELARLIYLPTQLELTYLNSFKFDVNVGTDAVLKLIDEDKGLEGLRRRGMFFMESNRSSMRMNYPAELRSAGLELSLMLAQQQRFDLDIRLPEFSFRREVLNVIAINGASSTYAEIEAVPTYDGFWSVSVPVGRGEFPVGIQFGLRYKWVQIESVQLVLTSALYGSNESQNTVDANLYTVVDQMRQVATGLYECVSEAGLLVFMPPEHLRDNRRVLRVVFRPVVSTR
jgi:FMN phosphatase YigB (HAD superfamily)